MSNCSELVLGDLQIAINNVHGRDSLNEMTTADGVGFVQNLVSLLACKTESVDYLEIGSFQGSSMSAFGLVLRSEGILGSLTSIDPYFEEGYFETPPHIGKRILKKSKPFVMQKAQTLYEQLGLDVRLLRQTSVPAIRQLIKESCFFDMVYVDGNHEQLNPMIDAGLAITVLKPGGVLVMDDTNWPDIQPVNDLLRKNLKTIHKWGNKYCFIV